MTSITSGVTAPKSAEPTEPVANADGRDGRVVGKNDDSAAESLGKAIIAPLEGADEDAEPAGKAA